MICVTHTHASARPRRVLNDPANVYTSYGLVLLHNSRTTRESKSIGFLYNAFYIVRNRFFFFLCRPKSWDRPRWLTHTHTIFSFQRVRVCIGIIACVHYRRRDAIKLYWTILIRLNSNSSKNSTTKSSDTNGAETLIVPRITLYNVTLSSTAHHQCQTHPSATIYWYISERVF